MSPENPGNGAREELSRPPYKKNCWRFTALGWEIQDLDIFSNFSKKA
jgi:hypothetical protein